MNETQTWKEIQLNEGSYSRVVSILRGLLPSVRTLAFITAENPYGKSLNPAENNIRNAEFQQDSPLTLNNPEIKLVKAFLAINEDGYYKAHMGDSGFKILDPTNF